MSIIRVSNHKTDFLVVDKKPFRDDNRLSWKAKGLLAYLLCLPDNWEVNRKEVSNHSKDGATAFDSGLKELKECGYCKVIKIRGGDGKFYGYDYTISESPDLENQETLPDSGKPDSEIPDQVNQNLFNIDIIEYIKKHKKEVLNILGVKEKKKASLGIFHSNTDGGKLAKFLLDKIEDNYPDFETPNLAAWEKAFNGMIFAKRLSYEEIKEVIIYSQDSNFWRAIVNSPYVLKAKYGTLKTQMQQRKRCKNSEKEKKDVFNRAKEESFD